MDNNGNRKLCNEQSKGGTCVNIEFSSSTYDENKYKCLCKDGFKGPKCNEGKKNKFWGHRKGSCMGLALIELHTCYQI